LAGFNISETYLGDLYKISSALLITCTYFRHFAGSKRNVLSTIRDLNWKRKLPL